MEKDRKRQIEEAARQARIELIQLVMDRKEITEERVMNRNTLNQDMLKDFLSLAQDYLAGKIGEYATEEEIFKSVYDRKRKTCASNNCEECPAFPENKEYPCGVKQMTEKLVKALVGKVAK